MSYKWYAYCRNDDLCFDDVNDCEYAAFTFIYTILRELDDIIEHRKLSKPTMTTHIHSLIWFRYKQNKKEY